jgi:hypothetical protein
MKTILGLMALLAVSNVYAVDPSLEEIKEARAFCLETAVISDFSMEYLTVDKSIEKFSHELCTRYWQGRHMPAPDYNLCRSAWVDTFLTQCINWQLYQK